MDAWIFRPYVNIVLYDMYVWSFLCIPGNWFRKTTVCVVWVFFRSLRCVMVGMKLVVIMVRTYMIQSKLEPLRAVAALPKDWIAGEDDWYP